MTFAEFIRSKTVPVFAQGLKTSEANVRMMLSRNNISRQHWPDILVIWPEVGMNDLLEMERTSRPG